MNNNDPGEQLGFLRGRGPSQKKGTLIEISMATFHIISNSDVIWDVNWKARSRLRRFEHDRKDLHLTTKTFEDDEDNI